MLPIPAPEPGGSLTELRSLLNLADDNQWILVVGWMIGALRVGRPTPILIVNGEQGSAKSTLSRILRNTIDPNKAPLRSPPRDERDLVIAAGNSLVLAYDNLSGISDSLSDSICRMATGGGFGTRALYTNDEEQMFDGIRPVLLNGIDDVANRADVLDRSIGIVLQVIPEEDRRDEATLIAEYERRRPRILGALLTALSTALRNLPTTKIDRLPRMADFSLFIAAAEPALPWKGGEFIRAYRANRAESNFSAIEGSPVAPPILAMIRAELAWSGSAGQLLKLLEARYTDEQIRRQKDWPQNLKAMGTAIRRVAPNLRAAGITVVLPRGRTGHTKQRIIHLEYGRGQRAAQAARDATPDHAVANTDCEDVGAAHPNASDDVTYEERAALAGLQGPPAAAEVGSAALAALAAHAAHAPVDIPHGWENPEVTQ